MGKSSGRDHAVVLVYGSIESMGLHSPRHKASGRSCLGGMNTPSFPQGEGVHTYPEFVWWSEFHSDHQTWQWKQHETTTLIYRWFQWFPHSNLIYRVFFHCHVWLSEGKGNNSEAHERDDLSCLRDRRSLMGDACELLMGLSQKYAICDNL